MPSSLVVGAGGLLGKGLSRELTRRGEAFERAVVPWDDSDAAADALVDALLPVLGGPDPWRLFWVAGTGVVATGEDDFIAEKDLIDSVLARVGPEARGGARGTVFFASSAGALYAGSTGAPFDEATDVHPLAPYGRSKLALEATFAEWSTRVGARLLVGRISNLYGPGQNLTKPQGLVSQLIAARLEARTSSIYVPMSTNRDYLFIDDAAGMILAAVDAVETGDLDATLKVFSARSGLSISEVIETVERVLGTSLLLETGESSSAAFQALDLRFDSHVLTRIDALPKTSFDEGVRLTADELRRAAGWSPETD